MEASLEDRLPEADSLPDGFVDSSAEPQPSPSPSSPTPPPEDVDYKDVLLDTDCNPMRRSPDSSGSVADPLPVADRVENGVTALPSPSPCGEGDDNLGHCRSSAEVARGCSTSGPVDVPKPRHGMSSLLGSERAGRDSGSSERRETLEFSMAHTTNSKSKEVPASENSESLKNQTIDPSEAKRKAGKRNVKSAKESPEFNFLKYQKVIAERDAAIAVRERLESLCRELQRQNKMLMEECQRVSTEGQNMRLEFSKKFSDAIQDVSKKLEAQKDECLAQLKENELLRNKLKHLTEQYTLSEQEFAEKLKQKMLELQLADLKLQQHQERTTQEQTQKQLYVEQVTQLLETEKNLRLQLAADGEKFQEFQDALSKSNEVFEAFKKEMEKMAKMIKDLKKENMSLKSKCEEKDFSLVKLLSERDSMKKELNKVTKQKEKLESLCRSLQAERKQNLIKTDPTKEKPSDDVVGLQCQAQIN